MNKEMPKAYEAVSYESDIYKKWEESGVFNPDNLNLPAGAKSYTIVMPPPNVTGTLHLGHAAMLAMEDLLIRYHRMKGERTLWVPGTDHAAIATQTKVEKIIKEEGTNRHGMGREKFLERVREFAQNSHDTIVNQVKKMGSSCDWSREAYTLDETRTRAVRSVFKMMYDDGLIYRGERIVNWCPRCHSTLADDEVEHKAQKAKLYYFRYDKNFPITIATTRPETKLGDTAVAVNPKDERYKKYVDQEFAVDFCGVALKIKVIADREVDMEFGTGALGVTPAHSMTDWQFAEKNDLPVIKVIDEDGNIKTGFGDFSNKSVKEARKLIVEKLQAQNLIEKEEEIENNLSLCYRCDTPVEPLPSLQWFIDVNKKVKRLNNKSIKETCLDAVKTGVFKRDKINIIPDRFEKTYFNWMENLRDWCISRQIWFGHQVPVWYKARTGADSIRTSADKDEIYVGVEAPEGIGWIQDPDTLDTWFSSGLWTFSTLGWPGGEIEILATRHGDTDVHGGRFIGQEEEVNYDLNEAGKEQAEELAEELKNEKIDLIFCSDSKRAVQTAEIVNKYHGLEVVQDQRIREYRFGYLSGLTFVEKTEKYPDAPEWKDLEIDQQFRDEERPIDVKVRVDSFVNEIKRKYAGKKILVVTHAGVLDFFHMIFEQKNFSEIKNLEHKKCKIEKYKIKTDDDFKNFHPTAVLETGYDIIFFWVARMIIMTTYAVGDIPFQDVYLHGLVLDDKGKKMSKSKGNVIDPLDMVKKYGTDATRLSLVIGSTPGSDMRLNEEKIASFRNFTNKLWNISRYIISNYEPCLPAGRLKITNYEFNEENLSSADCWILSKMKNLAKEVTADIENYRFSQAGEKLREFTWNYLADWYLEISKFEKTESKAVILNLILRDLLKLWHPFTPFVTEKIWEEMGNKNLITAEWPGLRQGFGEQVSDINFEVVKNVIIAIRNARNENKIEPAKKVKAVLVTKDKEFFESQAVLIKSLRTGIEELEIADSSAGSEQAKDSAYEGAISIVVGDVKIYLLGAVDKDKEKNRLTKEIANLEKWIKGAEGKLGNKEFLANAPAQIVEREQENLKMRKSELESLQERLKAL